MKSLHFVLGAVALCVAGAASAGYTNTYNFQTIAATSGATTWSNAQAGYNATNGTDYGNTVTYAAVSGPTNNLLISAWGSTGGVGGYNGTLQSAYVSHYTTGNTQELAITSRPGSGNTSELNNQNNPNTNNSQHAIDNVGSYESLLLSFQSAVTLNSVNIGFPTAQSGLDSDATVLVYTGSGDPTAGLSTRTYADLLNNGWQVAGNIMDMKTGQANTLTTSLSSKYWMVGAYMGIGGNSMTNVTNGGGDFFKVSGLTVTTAQTIPEPGSIALFGIAGAAFLAGRRRKTSTV